MKEQLENAKSELEAEIEKRDLKDKKVEELRKDKDDLVTTLGKL